LTRLVALTTVQHYRADCDVGIERSRKKMAEEHDYDYEVITHV